LKSWIEGHLGVDTLLILLGKIEGVDEVRGGIALRICRGDEGGELVVADVFVRRKLDQVQQRLLLVHVGEEGH